MNHPYSRYENSRIWRVINKGIDDLVNNNDIKELTAREYIVGYLCEKITHLEEETEQ